MTARAPFFVALWSPWAGGRTAQRVLRPGAAGYAVAEWPRDELHRLTDDPEFPLRLPGAVVVKRDRDALLAHVAWPVGGAVRTVAYKRNRRPTRFKQWLGSLRTDRALRTWRLGHRLLKCDIATARPLAVVVPRGLWASRSSYLASEWLDGTRHLVEFGRSLAALQPTQRRPVLRSAVMAVAQLIGRLHAARMSHRDLKSVNLLVRPRGDGVEAFVVDLDGVLCLPWLPAWRRWRDLARLVVDLPFLPSIGRTLRLRFLKTYLLAARGTEADWKREWRQLARSSERLARRKARRDRRRGRD